MKNSHSLVLSNHVTNYPVTTNQVNSALCNAHTSLTLRLGTPCDVTKYFLSHRIQLYFSLHTNCRSAVAAWTATTGVGRQLSSLLLYSSWFVRSLNKLKLHSEQITKKYQVASTNQKSEKKVSTVPKTIHFKKNTDRTNNGTKKLLRYKSTECYIALYCF